MNDPLASVLQRQRLLVALGLGGVCALAWAYTGWLAWRMDMPAMAVAAPRPEPWSAATLAFTFVMWAVMMVAMMVPSAAPMVLLYHAAALRRAQPGPRVVPTWAFLAGYLAVWTAFSALATLAQWGLHAAALLSPMAAAASPWLGAALLVAAGAFQFTALKRACLARCRTPLGFLMAEWRDGTRGAWVMGLRHGAYCTGCCWALMALLFVGGVMNLVWVAALAAVVLGEKVLPHGEGLGRAGGATLVAWGLWVAAAAAA